MEEQYDKAYIRKLAHKWKAGTLSSNERQQLERWDKSHPDDILKLEENSDPNAILDRLLSRIQIEIGDEQVSVVKVRRLWPRIAAAAAIIIVAGVGLLYFNQKSNIKQSQIVKNDIDPGHHGATLTLANGKKIKLTEAANGQLAKEAGVSITKSANGQLVYEITGNTTDENKINILSTEKGETYQVRLPDGSLIALNATSSLAYPANFTALKQRRVKLTGEGYFEIAKDKAHPFIVQTDKQEVEVLGTHFNINSYSDEPAIATTLVEGSVKVTSGNKIQIIKPGEQAINNGNSIKVAEANIDNITDWKDGDFYLDRVEFRTAMRKIARWYNVEVVYDKSVPDDIESGGWISRNKKLSTILKFIESSGQVHFKLEGRTVYVSK